MNEKSIDPAGHAARATGQPLRLGIVGFGHLAQNYYVPALRKMGRQLEIRVADPLKSSRMAASSMFADARIYPDYRQLLEEEALQALLVAAPPSRHLEIWHAASQLGLPVFMEKPFPLADELEHIDAADPAWRKLMINFNRRFWPAYRSLGQHVADGSLGRIMRASFVLEVNAQKWSRITNHRACETEGGVLHDLGSQVLDLVLLTFGQQPDEILARRSGDGMLNQRVDLTLRFAEGLDVDCRLAYGTRNRESVTIEGEKATLQMRDPNFLCWLEHDPSLPGRFARSVADFAALGYRGLFRSRSMLRYSISASLEAFFENLATSRPFHPGLWDGLQVTRCIAAASDSLAVLPGRK